MKKVLIFLLVGFFVAYNFSCSSENNEDIAPPPKKEIPEPEITKIEFESTERPLIIGDELDLEVVHTPSNLSAPTYGWESSTPNVATVSNGRVTAISKGEAIIKATIEDKDLMAPIKIVVSNIEAEKIDLSVSEKTLEVDETFQLEATISPSNTTVQDITWESSNPNIATVDDTGHVIAIGEGDVDMTASTTNGFVAVSMITVIGKRAREIVFSETEKSSIGDTYYMLLETSKQLKFKVLPEDAENHEIKWSWYNPNTSHGPVIGSIDKNGLLTLDPVAKDGHWAFLTASSVANPTTEKSVNIVSKDIKFFIKKTVKTENLSIRNSRLSGEFTVTFENTSPEGISEGNIRIYGANIIDQPTPALAPNQKIEFTFEINEEFNPWLSFQFTHRGNEYWKSFDIEK